MPRVESFELLSGHRCHLVAPRMPFREGYRVLVFEAGQPGPTGEEQAEMLTLALTLARRLSSERFANPECYLLIHNGLGARRRRDFHCHVIAVSGRGQKTLVYLWLFLKNAMHPFWVIGRPLRHALVRPRGLTARE